MEEETTSIELSWDDEFSELSLEMDLYSEEWKELIELFEVLEK